MKQNSFHDCCKGLRLISTWFRASQSSMISVVIEREIRQCETETTGSKKGKRKTSRLYDKQLKNAHFLLLMPMKLSNTDKDLRSLAALVDLTTIWIHSPSCEEVPWRIPSSFLKPGLINKTLLLLRVLKSKNFEIGFPFVRVRIWQRGMHYIGLMGVMYCHRNRLLWSLVLSGV